MSPPPRGSPDLLTASPSSAPSALLRAGRVARERALRFLVPGYGHRIGRALWILFFGRVVNAVAFSASFPFLATHLASERGVAATAVGALYMAQGGLGAAFQLVGGELTVRFGSRALLMFSLGTRTFVSLGLGLLLHLHAPLAPIVALVVMNGILAGLFQPAADSLVAGLTRGDERIAAFAHQRVAINIGWAAGPILGGVLAATTSFATLFVLAAPGIALSAWLVSRLEKTGLRTAPRENPIAALREQLSDGPLRLQLVGALLSFVLAGQMVVTLSVEAGTRLALDKHHLGLLWTMNGVLIVLLQMPFAGLVRRMGTRTALVSSALLYGAGFASVGLADSFGEMVLCMLVISSGELLNAPSQQSAVAARAHPEHVGRALGLLGLTMMLGRAAGPLLGGAAHDALGGSPMLMWATLGSLGLLAALAYASTPPPAAAQAAPARLT